MADLISRQAAIDLVKDVCDAIMSCCGSHYDEETDDEVCDDILEIDAILKCNKEMRIALKNMPSAEPERKTGRWVERNPQNSPDCRLIECSECGNAYIVGYNIDYDDWIDGRNFCMKCGADLRGGNNGKNT